MESYCVYMHITPNGKKYVGITKQKPNRRWKNGYGYVSSPYFYNAILKYGWDNIKHTIIADNLSLDDACKLERQLIEQYNLTNREFGYNECSGGEGTNGYHHTEEYKQKLRNRPISTAQRKQISRTVKQRWAEGAYDGITYNRIPWNKGLTKDDPRLAKCVRKVGEYHHSDETRQKISLSQKGRIAHNRKRVECVETGVIYNSISEASQLTGITTVAYALSRRGRGIAGNLHWRFIDD